MSSVYSTVDRQQAIGNPGQMDGLHAIRVHTEVANSCPCSAIRVRVHRRERRGPFMARFSQQILLNKPPKASKKRKKNWNNFSSSS